MKKSSNTFAAKVATLIIVAAILAVTIPFGIVSCAMNNKPVRFFKIQRMNINGEVQQIYYSQSFPCNDGHCIYFKEYPSGKYIKFFAPYTAEDIGTNKP